MASVKIGSLLAKPPLQNPIKIRDQLLIENSSILSFYNPYKIIKIIMFSCELSEGIVLKKIIDAIKDVVNQVTLEITPEGMGFQAMDMSHVALVSLQLKADEFTSYKTHKNHSLGIRL